LPANFLKQTDSLCPYDHLLLQSTKNYSSYLWSNGAAQSNITIQDPGQYWLQVTDVNGCKGLDTIKVLSKVCNAAVYIPTAFTPNNDGKNDFFKATVYGHLLSFKLEVFDRYGELVFRSSDPLKKWDGLYKDGSFSTNTFVWQCVYQLEGNQPVYRRGTVLLIR
jgi:gliding motility-associated-like protein